LEGASGEQQRVCLSTAHAAACSLLRIVEAAQDGAWIDSGRFLPEQTPFDLRHWAIEMASVGNLSFEWPGFSLNLTIEAEVPVLVLGDAQRVRQVLSSLIGHLVKKCRVKTADLRLAARREGARQVVLFVLGESGALLPASVRERLFQEGGMPSSASGPEQGFHLEISRQIATRLGGAVCLDCAPENGYLCALSMPFFSPSGPPGAIEDTPAAWSTDPDRPKAGRILLVEDDPGIRMFVEILLRRKGWEVVIARDGLEAVSARRQNTFDLALMDLRMPTMDGLEATRLIREEERAAGWVPLPIIGLTARAGVEDRQICLQTGMNGHLAKPVRSAELYAMIDRCIDRS
jgi:CheY-like chemotaxis protein